MNLQPVNAPPHFRYMCLADGRTYSTATMPAVADLHGPAFRAYYCEDCARNIARRMEQPS
jgi:hypothetical protein